MGGLNVEPVGPDRLGALGQLFSTSRATRHCWCTAYCSTAWQFALGWYGGGNRRRFETRAAAEPQPMGVVAIDDDEPVGWCACGPRTRYTAAAARHLGLLARGPASTDDCVWFIACLYVRPDRAGDGIVVPLLRGALEAARQAGAIAVEAWPLARGIRRPGEAHLGREGVFARLGFRRTAQPTPHRVIMWLDLPETAHPVH